MKKVEFELDHSQDLTASEKKNLKRLAAMPDGQIDTSDIPELTDEQFAQMQRSAYFRPIKKQITARLDADVLAWLKADGKGYQSRMNAILRKAMLEAK